MVRCMVQLNNFPKYQDIDVILFLTSSKSSGFYLENYLGKSGENYIIIEVENFNQFEGTVSTPRSSSCDVNSYLGCFNPKNKQLNQTKWSTKLTCIEDDKKNHVDILIFREVIKIKENKRRWWNTYYTRKCDKFFQTWMNS